MTHFIFKMRRSYGSFGIVSPELTLGLLASSRFWTVYISAYDMNLARSYLTTACIITDAPVAQSSAELNSSG